MIFSDFVFCKKGSQKLRYYIFLEIIEMGYF